GDGGARPPPAKQGLGLQLAKLLDATRRQVEQRIELAPLECAVLGRALHLDQLAVCGHDHVHVDTRRHILDVRQVQNRGSVDDAHADRRPSPPPPPPRPHPAPPPCQGDPAPRQAGRAPPPSCRPPPAVAR